MTPTDTINAINAAYVFACDDILESLAAVEAHLDQQYESHDEWVKANKHLVNASGDAESFAVDGYCRLGGTLPSVLRASLFTYAYGRLEYSLHTLCKLLQAVCGVKRGPEDLKDKGFVRSRKYLEKVIGIVWNAAEADVLKTVGIYGVLRNAILHNNGVLRPEADEAKKYIEQAKGIHLNGDRLLLFEDGFVFEAILHMKKAWQLVDRSAQRAVQNGSASSLAVSAGTAERPLT